MRVWCALLVVFVSGAALARTPEEQNKCSAEALKIYKTQEQEVLQRGGGEYHLTVGGIMAQRRMMESYCMASIECVDTPSLSMGAAFTQCLQEREAAFNH
jgi:hypothetical protein